MSKPNTTLTPFYGVSNHNCNNRKLFDFVENYQKTGKTVLEFRKRIEDGKVEEFIGLSIDVDEDGAISMLSLMFQQGVFDKDEHAQASNTTPKIYFL